MIIPFSGDYHVPDLIVWGSFSCPLLVIPRTANRRRTERASVHNTRMVPMRRRPTPIGNWFFFANVCKRSILAALLVARALLQSPPRTLNKAEAGLG